MNRLVLLLVSFASLAIPSQAARAAEVRTDRGSRALVFTFAGLSNLRLQNYQGGIGLRCYLRDDLAIRPGMSWSWSWRKTHADPVPPGEEKPSDTREIDTSVGLNTVIEKHFEGAKSISPYLGAGIEGTYHNNKFEPGVTHDAPAGTLTKITERGWTAGVLGLLGFEWGWTDSITLGGEYRLSFRASANTSEHEQRGGPDQQFDSGASFSSDFSTSSLYVSVAF